MGDWFDELGKLLATPLRRGKVLGVARFGPRRAPGELFDSIARTLATPMPRRRMLGVIAGTLVAGASAGARPRRALGFDCPPSLPVACGGACCGAQSTCYMDRACCTAGNPFCYNPPRDVATCCRSGDGETCCAGSVIGSVCCSGDQECVDAQPHGRMCCPKGFKGCTYLDSTGHVDGYCCPPDFHFTATCGCIKNCEETSGNTACGEHCCVQGETCCGGKVCCLQGEQCCGDHCCAENATCCSDHCCGRAETCCGSSLCCGEGETCCGGTTCCPPDQVCRDGACLADVLLADPGGPYTVLRGGVVKLDGSKSRPQGKITSYRWTFSNAVCPEGITAHADAHKEGQQASIRALCSITATLTVSDGTSSDQKSVTITVKPRPWKTKFEHRGERKLVHSRLLYPCLICEWGRNVCALDGLTGDQRSNHFLHRGKRPYRVTQVKDSGGPFDGVWYVTNYALQVIRMSLINSNLYPGTELYRVNAASKKKIGLVLASVRAHERMHSTLLKEALPKTKLAPNVEKLGGSDAGDLREQVEFKIREAETALGEATSEAHVHKRLRAAGWNRSAVIVLPNANGDYRDFRIPSLANVGE